MANLNVEELYIINRLDKVARKVEFKRGLNIITSKENHVGKSTIMKSIYYTLGAEINNGKLAKKDEMIYLLKFEISNNTYYLMRHNNNFMLKNNNKVWIATNEIELTEIIENIFRFTIFLESENEEIIKAPPVFYYLPYYINQDTGWDINPLSFNNLTNFKKNDRDDAFYYHLGIFNESYGINKIQKSRLLKERREFKKEKIKILSLRKYINENISTFDLGLEYSYLDLEEERRLEKFKKYSYDVNNLHREILSLKDETKKADNIIVHLNNTIQNSIKKRNSITEDFNVTCPFCLNQYEVDSKEFLNVNYEIEDITSSKLALIKIKSEAEIEISKKQLEIEKFKLEIEKIEKGKMDSKYNVEDILKYKGLLETKETLKKKLGEIEFNIEETSQEIKDINIKMESWEALKKDANKTYQEKLLENLEKLNVLELVTVNNISMGSNLVGDGSGQARINLARFYSTIQTINESNEKFVRLPFLIDSPKSGEQSIPSSKSIFELIINKESHGATISNQVIVASVDFIHLNHEKLKEINVIEIKTPKFKLLTSSDYLENEKVIDEVLAIYISEFE